MQGDEGLALDIAHYNYELRFRSCGLFRGTQGFALRTYKALPLTRSGRCPETPPRAACPMEPRKGVTLPLDHPAQWHLPLRTLSRK